MRRRVTVGRPPPAPQTNRDPKGQHAPLKQEQIDVPAGDGTLGFLAPRELRDQQRSNDCESRKNVRDDVEPPSLLDEAQVEAPQEIGKERKKPDVELSDPCHRSAVGLLRKKSGYDYNDCQHRKSGREPRRGLSSPPAPLKKSYQSQTWENDQLKAAQDLVELVHPSALRGCMLSMAPRAWLVLSRLKSVS